MAQSRRRLLQPGTRTYHHSVPPAKGFDHEGNIVGLTLVRPKRLLERAGELRVTLPVSSEVSADELAPALT
jgi:hypothetical protein